MTSFKLGRQLKSTLKAPRTLSQDDNKMNELGDTTCFRVGNESLVTLHLAMVNTVNRTLLMLEIQILPFFLDAKSALEIF